MKPSSEQFREAITKIERFSPAPRILGKALALLRNPDSAIDDIAALIKTDTALTAQIIRSANSAFYGGGGQFSSPEQAMQQIGFRESIRLLNLAAMHVMLARGLDNYGITGDAFWTESLFHGLFMENLAHHTQAHDPDEAHTAGLLRFIGRLALNQSIEDVGCGIFWDETIPLETWESENVGFSQNQAGAILLRAWQFSEPMIEAIEWQAEPGRASHPNWLAQALNFASLVIPHGTHIHSVIFTARMIKLLETDFALQHELTAEMLDHILTETHKKFSDANNTF